jgi:hypothetical protein
MALQDNSNLLKQVRANSITRFPRAAAFYKILGLDILIILAAFFSSETFLDFLDGKLSFWLPVFSVAFLMAFSVFEVLMGKNFFRRSVVLILEIIAVILPFYLKNQSLSYYYFLTAAVALIFFLFLGELQSRRSLDDNIRVRFFRVAKKELSKLTTALVLVFLIFYFPQANAQKSVALSQYFFDGIYGVSVKLANGLYPEINLSGSYGDFIKSMVDYQLSGDIRFETMPPAIQNQLRSQATAQLMSQISGRLGMSISAKDSLNEVFQTYFMKILNGWRTQYGVLFFGVWLLALFFSIRSVAVVFYWSVALVFYLIYEILIASDFLRLIPKNRIQEVVEI